MIRSRFIVGVAAALGVAAASAWGFADRPRARRRAAAPAPTAEAPPAAPKGMPAGWDPLRFPPEAMRPAPLTWHVYPRPGAGGPERELHEEAAQLIAASHPPLEHRARHFAWVAREGGIIDGWGATVQHVEPMSGSYRVTLRVKPHVTVNGASGTIVNDYLLEEYLISHGQVHYIRGIDPPDAVPGGIVTD